MTVRSVAATASIAGLLSTTGIAADTFYKDSQWTPRAILPAEDALRGDFWPTSPKTDVDYDDAAFESSRLLPPPPPGVYPRVVVTPGDVERIREKVAMGERAPASFQVMWERVKRSRSPFYALVAKDDALGKELASAFAKKVHALEGKLDKIDARPDHDNLWVTERSFVASGDPDPPSEIGALLDYDYLHGWLSPEDRAATERVIARLTKGRITNFMTYPDHFMINNHQGFGMEFLRMLLLIEGSKDFDSRVYKLAAHKARAMLDWYLDADGMCYESIKGWLNTNAFVALARREPDLLKHSHLRAKMRFFQNAIHWQDGRWQIREEMRASAFPVIWMMRYFHTKDPVLDWLYSATFTTHDFLTNPDARWPDPVGVSPELLLLFAEDGMKDAHGHPIDWADQNRIDALHLPLTWIDNQRGYMITRNSWEKDDIQLGLTCKQDFYYGGHEGSENNRIVLWADGVNWVRDSNMLAVKATFLQNMLTVDGKGLAWPPAPGVWLGAKDTGAGVAAAGDGKIGYSYGKVMQVHPLDFPSVKLPYYAPFAEGNYDLTRDLQVAFHPGTVAWNDGYAHTDYGPWSGETRLVEHYRENNPMEQAYRTVYLARGEHPYVLVIDDAVKDGREHLFEWNITLPEGIDLLDARTPEVAFQNVPPTERRDNDLLLGRAETPRDPKTRAAQPAKGDPLLLVRTLWRNSPYGFPVPQFEKFEVEPQAPYAGLGHVTIPAISASPEFRVLLYPHRKGDPVPETKWNEDRSQLTVKVGGVTDLYRFGKTDGGRTVFSVERNGKVVFQSGAAPARPVIRVRGERFDANDLRTTRLDGHVPEYVFDGGVDVVLERPAAPAYVTYTLDGSEPGESSPRWTGPLHIDRAAKLAARMFDPAWTAGPSGSAVLRADFKPVKPAAPHAVPETAKPGLLARFYEKKTVMWNDRGFFDASKVMLPDLDKISPAATTIVPEFELPRVVPGKPVEEQAKGFYRFNGWYRAPERGVYEFAVNSCGPVRMDVGGQRAIEATGIFHQQQAVRRGDVVLEAGWHPLELIVTDPLAWNLNTAGEMPFNVTVRQNGLPAEEIETGDLRAAAAPDGTMLTAAPALVWKEAGRQPEWLEPGMDLSVYPADANRKRQPDYLDIETQKAVRTERIDRMKPNLRPSTVRVYDGWFLAPVDGVYAFDMPARRSGNAGLGELRAAYQNQMRIDGEVIVQHGVPGRRPTGLIGLKAGWHEVSIRLGASGCEPTVTTPDGQKIRLTALEFQRPSKIGIQVNGDPVTGSVREIYGPVEVTLGMPPGRSGEIRYTVDGSAPDARSPVAHGPVRIEKSTRLRAAVVGKDGRAAAETDVQFNRVNTPEAGLIAAPDFSQWDGQTGMVKADANASIWVAPEVVRGTGRSGEPAPARPASDDKLKSPVNVNVSRGPVLASVRVTGLTMPDNALTVAMWVKSDTADGKLFGKDGYNAFGKAYRTVSAALNRGRLTADPGRLSGGSVKPGEWAHVALTADESASRLYLNGTLVASGEGSNTIVTDALDILSSHPATLGGLRIYDRVLSEEDVKALANEPPAGTEHR